MGAARKFIDIAADFLIFVMACFYIMSGMSDIAVMLDSLHRSLSDKGMSEVEEFPVSYITGTELIAMFCYPEGIWKVVMEGNTYVDKINTCASKVSADATYSVERYIDSEGKVTLTINKSVS